MNKIKELIKESGVHIEFVKFYDCNGFYLPAMNTIFINDSLSDGMKLGVILHEIAHCKKHKDKAILYELATNERLKMEREANTFMLQEQLELYIRTNNVEKEDINAITFLQSQGLSLKFEADIKKIIKNL